MLAEAVVSAWPCPPATQLVPAWWTMQDHFTFAPCEKPRLMKLLFQALADAATADEHDQQRRKTNRSRRSGHQQQQRRRQHKSGAADEADAVMAAGPGVKRRRTLDDGLAAMQARGSTQQELETGKENAVSGSSLAGDCAAGGGLLGKATAVTQQVPGRTVDITRPQQAP